MRRTPGMKVRLNFILAEGFADINFVNDFSSVSCSGPKGAYTTVCRGLHYTGFKYTVPEFHSAVGADNIFVIAFARFIYGLNQHIIFNR